MAWWSAVPLLGNILDKIIPDNGKSREAQIKLNEAEIAGAPASILRLWRPFLGWCLSLVFVWEIVGRNIILTYWPEAKLPPSYLGETSRILLAMLGLGF